MPANAFGIDYGEILRTKGALVDQQQRGQMNALALRRGQREEDTANAFAQFGGDVLSGDPAKSNAALGQIARFDPGQALELASRLTAEQRTAAAEKSEYTGRALLGLKGIPAPQRAQAWSAMAAQLNSRGIEAPAQIDTSDEGLDLAISTNISLKDAMVQANANRDDLRADRQFDATQDNARATREATEAYRGATLEQRERIGRGSSGTQETWNNPVQETGPDGKPIMVRYGNRGGREMVPDARPAPSRRTLPSKVVNDLVKAGTNLENLGRLKDTFQERFGGNTVLGDTANTIGRLVGDETGQSQWWQDYQSYINVVRNQLFGAALTPQEKSEFEKAIATPRMNSGEINKNLKRQYELAVRAAQRQAAPYAASGYDQESIDGALGMSGDDIQAILTPVAAPKAGAATVTQPSADNGNVPTATGPNGQKLFLRNGQWSPQ